MIRAATTFARGYAACYGYDIGLRLLILLSFINIRHAMPHYDATVKMLLLCFYATPLLDYAIGHY